MAIFKVTLKVKRGNMPAGTTLMVDTKNLTSLDPDKIQKAVKDAGYNSEAQHDSINKSLWIVEKVR